jgi:capsular exopolysaccharide synthesis family protein
MTSSAVNVRGEERQGTARYLQALAQHWPFIIGSAALAVVSAALYLAVAQDRYQAHADLLVTPVASDDDIFVGLPVIRETTEGRSVLTAARFIETPEVADAVRKRLHLQSSAKALLGAIRVAPQQQSNIVTVTAESSSPERAAALANGFAHGVVAVRTLAFQRELRGVVKRLAKRLDSAAGSADARAVAGRLASLRGLVGSRDPTLQVTSLAVPPTEPSWPRPKLSMAAALLVGLVLGIGIAVALELVNPVVLRDEDVDEERLPLLAKVPRLSPRDLRNHASGTAFGGGVQDAFRLARVNLRMGSEAGADPATILVSSAARGEGKTTVALDLAVVYALTGARVVLVDADLRRARLTRLLEVRAPGYGLRELLAQEADVSDVLTPLRAFQNRLRVVAAAPDDGRAVDLLQSDRSAQLVDELKAHADVVIFDSTPLTEVADALPLATVVDAVVVVVRYGRTRRDRLADTHAQLGQLGIAPAGVVAVTRRRRRERARGQAFVPPRPAPEKAQPRPRTRRTRTRSSSART